VLVSNRSDTQSTRGLVLEKVFSQRAAEEESPRIVNTKISLTQIMILLLLFLLEYFPIYDGE
jgi:hypothetical protein